MPAQANGSLQIIAESHEDRLQRVEENLKDLSVCVGKMQTAQEGFSDKVETSSKAILDKLEGMDHRLDPLEKNYTRYKSISGFVKTIIIAGASAFAGGMGLWFWEVLSK